VVVREDRLLHAVLLLLLLLLKLLVRTPISVRNLRVLWLLLLVRHDVVRASSSRRLPGEGRTDRVRRGEAAGGPVPVHAQCFDCGEGGSG